GDANPAASHPLSGPGTRRLGRLHAAPPVPGRPGLADLRRAAGTLGLQPAPGRGVPHRRLQPLHAPSRGVPRDRRRWADDGRPDGRHRPLRRRRGDDGGGGRRQPDLHGRRGAGNHPDAADRGGGRRRKRPRRRRPPAAATGDDPGQPERDPGGPARLQRRQTGQRRVGLPRLLGARLPAPGADPGLGAGARLRRLRPPPPADGLRAGGLRHRQQPAGGLPLRRPGRHGPGRHLRAVGALGRAGRAPDPGPHRLQLEDGRRPLPAAVDRGRGRRRHLDPRRPGQVRRHDRRRPPADGAGQRANRREHPRGGPDDRPGRAHPGPAHRLRLDRGV
ncbi:MAG: hypothetical protein AVDCRST_MAG59-4422, partial [uncultured Thermomicrobiales bacterium]